MRIKCIIKKDNYTEWYLFFFKQKTAYEMRISDWSSDVCSSDLVDRIEFERGFRTEQRFVVRHRLRIDLLVGLADDEGFESQLQCGVGRAFHGSGLSRRMAKIMAVKQAGDAERDQRECEQGGGRRQHRAHAFAGEQQVDEAIETPAQRGKCGQRQT